MNTKLLYRMTQIKSIEIDCEICDFFTKGKEKTLG